MVGIELRGEGGSDVIRCNKSDRCHVLTGDRL
jgi:hypothetical protein